LQAGSAWITTAVNKKFTQLLSAHNALADEFHVIERAPGLTHAEHDRLWLDGKLLMERLSTAGFLASWVVGRGTMIFAMRYGQSRGIMLPSGHLDAPHQPSDMDIYVHTADWALFSRHLTLFAYEMGFEFCSPLPNWPEGTLACRRGGGELDFTHIKLASEISSMVPTSRCLVAPAAEAGLESFELACPREPQEFMRQIWGRIGAKKSLTDCLPLPSTVNGEVKLVSEEDLRYLWRIAVKLQRGGFASMAPYFGSCRNHPLELFARGLSAAFFDDTFHDAIAPPPSIAAATSGMLSMSCALATNCSLASQPLHSTPPAQRERGGLLARTQHVGCLGKEPTRCVTVSSTALAPPPPANEALELSQTFGASESTRPRGVYASRV